MTSSYLPIGVNLTQNKARRLMAGHAVHLGKEAHGGSLKVHMTRRQADKWAKHSKAGKGMILRMSTAQIRHHKRGSIQNVDTSTRSSGGGVSGSIGVRRPRSKRPRPQGRATAAVTKGTRQKPNSADHPVVTTFEKDPLPGEHYAIPQ